MFGLIKKMIRKRTFPLRAAFFYWCYGRRWRYSARKLCPKGDTVLILAPHADDEYIGCGGLISKYKDTAKLHAFLCSYLGADPSEENRRRREKEFKNSCEEMRVFCHIADRDMENELRRCIDEVKPGYIFLTTLVDPHREHRELNFVLQKILGECGYAGKIVWYSVTMPVAPDFLNCYIPMSKLQDIEKWDGFYRLYPSQSHMHIERFRTEERFAGRAAGCAYAEGFVEMAYGKWHDAVGRWDEDYGDILDRIKREGRESCLLEVYQTSGRLYRSLFR